MFNLFKKKEPPKTVFDYRREKAQKAEMEIAELSHKFPVGSAFNYMGVKCLVCHTFYYYDDPIYIEYMGFFPSVSRKAALSADYVDNNGVIRTIKLSYEEAMRLEK